MSWAQELIHIRETTIFSRRMTMVFLFGQDEDAMYAM